MFYHQNTLEITRKNERRKKELELSIQRMNENLKVFFEELEEVKKTLAKKQGDPAPSVQKETSLDKKPSQESKAVKPDQINPSWLFIR